MLRVALCFQNFGPYHQARLDACRREGGLHVVGLELARRQAEYAWIHSATPDQVSLVENRPMEDVAAGEWFGLAAPRLAEIAPDAVAIAGYGHPGMRAILRWCWESRTPAILMSDSRYEDEPRSGWKELIKGRMVRGFSAGLAAGSPHVEYLMRLGMPREVIFTGYDVVDNDYFVRGVQAARKMEVNGNGKHHPPPEGPEKYFLASSRFIPKKNLPGLLQAYHRYLELARGAKVPPWKLVLLGDGPLREDIEGQISELGLGAQVSLPGFVQYADLPGYYGGAGVFIHASTTDQWGLVVNEAMASGLPVLVSRECGCARDLVQEDRNGFTFDPRNSEELGRRMWELSTRPDLAAMGRASREIIAAWGPERFAASLRSAAQKARELGPFHPPLLDRLLLRGLLRS